MRFWPGLWRGSEGFASRDELLLVMRDVEQVDLACLPNIYTQLVSSWMLPVVNSSSTPLRWSSWRHSGANSAWNWQSWRPGHAQHNDEDGDDDGGHSVRGNNKMIRLRYCRVQMCPGLNSAPARRVTLDSPVRWDHHHRVWYCLQICTVLMLMI